MLFTRVLRTPSSYLHPSRCACPSGWSIPRLRGVSGRGRGVGAAAARSFSRSLARRDTSSQTQSQTQSQIQSGSQPNSPPPSWSSTLLLPKSSFPARPVAAERPKYLARCTTELYEWQKDRRKDQTPFVLHDGPPYANGQLHIGHALNKVVKDIILRVQLAKGRRVEYVPGWDCHGLPIELKALQRQRDLASVEAKETKETASKEQGSTTKDIRTEQEKGAEVEGYDSVTVRTLARGLAAQTVEDQRRSFRDWAILGDWDNAWTTMQPDFELRQLEVFRQMLEKGLIYRRFKPVYWSPSTRTALAEGELEYNAEHASIAAFVRFQVVEQEQEQVRSLFGISSTNASVGFLIWTTTPWTLPANKAVAVRDDLPYVCAHFSGHGWLIVAESRLAEVERVCKVEHDGLVYGPVSGKDLVGLSYRNGAFTTGQVSKVFHADYVSADSGTGLVHTAPGHGMDDYKLGLQHGIEPFAPLDGLGRYTRDAFSQGSAAEYLLGAEVTGKGNTGVLKYLKAEEGQDGTKIIKSYKYTHSYPYDWRSKQPIIIRATAQWFADLGEIRDLALKAIEDVNFVPPSGRDRLTSTVRNRTEWCISRQRAWGVPIPALYRKENGEALLTPTSVAHIIATIRERGIDAWWTDAADEQAWIPPSERGSDYARGTDTMDVWFDSGSSWTHMGRDVKDRSKFVPETADVYLEGSDQHRGWFQSSILTKIAYDAAMGHQPSSPFKTLITHGFTLDGQGRKMSKSEGNVVSPEEIVKGTLLPPVKRKGKVPQTGDKAAPVYDSFGSDALRFLLAGSDYTKDVQIGPTILKVLHNNLAKLRVTFRLLTGLLSDYNPQSMEGTRLQDLGMVNQMALLHLQEVNGKVWRAYDDMEYYKAVAALNEYINADFSAFFIEAIKDRMYTGIVDGAERRNTQFTLWHVFEELCAMLQPLTPLLVEEAKAHLPGRIEDGLHHLTPRRFFHQDDLISGAEKTLLKFDTSKSAVSNDQSVTLDDIRRLTPFVTKLNAAVKALLEEKRADKVVGSSLQAHVLIRELGDGEDDLSKDSEASILRRLPNFEAELSDIVVVSRVTYVPAVTTTDGGANEDSLVSIRHGWSASRTIGDTPDTSSGASSNPEDKTGQCSSSSRIEVTIYQPPPQQVKCERCWKHTANEDEALCKRCEDVVGENRKR